LELNPEFANGELWLAGEGYSGVLIPKLAKMILD